MLQHKQKWQHQLSENQASGSFRCFHLELRHWCAAQKKAIEKAPANRCDSHVILRCSLRTPCNVTMQASPYIASCAAGDALFSQCVHNALEAHGAVAVSHIPGLASAREMALRSVSRCLVSTAHRTTSWAEATATSSWRAVAEKMYPDATTRRTLSARTVNGIPKPLPGQGALECENLADTYDLRTIVNDASGVFLNALEPLVLPGAHHGLLDARDADGVERVGAYNSFAQLSSASEITEHFHAYYKPAQGDLPTSEASREPSPAPSSEPLHTEMALFVSLVPALHLELQPSGDGDILPHENQGKSLALPVSPGYCHSAVIPFLTATISSSPWDKSHVPRMFSPACATPHISAHLRATICHASAIIQLAY